ESLSFELHPFGIHVVLVEPGSYRTKIFSENARQARRAGDPDSPYTSYARMFQAYIKGMLSSKNQMGDPETVAALMERIVNHPHPRLRYLIGGGARLRVLARRVLPFHWFAAVVRKKLFGNSSAD
ncbi:MAG: short-chain dehydrogenase, partial [Fidelibacterota bacterium]